MIKFIKKLVRFTRSKLLESYKTVKIHIVRDKFLIAHAKWVKDKGDETLRMNYDLTQNSVVFDLGGYRGDFADKIFEKYGCSIYIFEPVKSFYDDIVERFKNNDMITIFNFGLSDRDCKLKINLSADGSSVFDSSKNTTDTKELISLKDITLFLDSQKIKKIDLMKINIEGGEFEVVPALIKSGNIENVVNIQVQFHTFVNNAIVLKDSIRSELNKTHYLTYDYWFIWENWRLKNE